MDDEYAAVKYKNVNEAYHVLVDAHKRKLYDQRGDKPSNQVAAQTPSAADSGDVTSLGGIGRVFGAVISRLGIPINTTISQDIILTAQTICKHGGIEGGGPPIDPRVSDLPWGWAAEGKVDRSIGAYYRLTVDPQHAEAGFIIHVRSVTKGKFKLILFDKEGVVLHQEESLKERDLPYTQSTLFFTNFDTYSLPENAIVSGDKSLPNVFHRLESYTYSKKRISPAQYLLCVYGDNFIGKTSFSIIAVPSKNDSTEVHGLEEADETLLETKAKLETLKQEYVQV